MFSLEGRTLLLEVWLNECFDLEKTVFSLFFSSKFLLIKSCVWIRMGINECESLTSNFYRNFFLLQQEKEKNVAFLIQKG